MSWTPANMGNELIQWLKADAITGLANNDPVSSWVDSSVNGRHVTGASTVRPLYLTNQINGYPAVNFDGVNDRLSSASYSLSGQRICAVVVLSFDTLKNYQAPWQIHSTATPTYTAAIDWFTCYLNGSGYQGGRGRYSFYEPATIAGSAFIIIASMVSDLSGPSFRKNGLTIAPSAGSYPGVSPVTNYSGSAYTHLGDGGDGLQPLQFFDGSIAEFVLCDNSSLDDVWLEGYLAHKYAITLSASHPFYAAAPTSGPRVVSGLTGIKNKGIRVS